MKILLLSPPYVSEYMRNARCDFVSLSATQWYPILLGYCGAYLQNKGHDVVLIDAPAQGLSHEETMSKIRQYSPHLLIVYSGRMSEVNDVKFTDAVVELLGCKAVIVGPYASINPERVLKRSKNIAWVIKGEFDPAVADIAEGKQETEIKNLVYKKGDTYIHNPIRDYLSGDELDKIPFVSRFFKQQVNIYWYKTPSEYYPFMDIISARGCQYGMCTYCLWPNTYIKGGVYHKRSIDNVIEEFRFIEKDIPELRSVMIQDDTFTEQRAVEFCEAKIKAGINLPWSCYVRANMSYKVLKLMKLAGCRNLHVGYESASDKVLKFCKKGISVKRMEEFTRDAKRAGLRIHGDFAFGFYEETLQDAEKTIEWAYKLNPHTAQFQIMIPFEGTPYYEKMKNRGWLNQKGEPDMPQFSNQQIRATAKKAYRRFYLSPQYLYKCIKHPYEHFFGRLKTISRALPAMLWRSWKI